MTRVRGPVRAVCLAALLAGGALAQTTDQTGGAATDGSATGTGAAEVPVDPNAPSTLPEVNAPPVLFVSAHGGTVRVLDSA